MLEQGGAGDAVQEMLLQGPGMGMDDAGRDAFVRQPAHDGVEAVETGRIEGRAHEAPAVVAVADLAVLRTGEVAEGRVPAGVARAQAPARAGNA